MLVRTFAVTALLFCALAVTAQEPTLADLAERIRSLEALTDKIGIVSEPEIMDNLEEKKEIDVDSELMARQIEAEIAPMRAEREAMENELKMMGEGNPARAERIRAYQQKMEEFHARSLELQERLQRQHQRKINTLRTKIRGHIARYAQKNKYTLIIDSTALLYGEGRQRNLTTEIIDQMNAEYNEQQERKLETEEGAD